MRNKTYYVQSNNLELFEDKINEYLSYGYIIVGPAKIAFDKKGNIKQYFQSLLKEGDSNVL